MAITLTATERAVLAHMVSDPDAWLAHAESSGFKGDARAALDAKVAKWQGAYDADKRAKGGSYKTRAQRDAE